jgi:hypothetical protein
MSYSYLIKYTFLKSNDKLCSEIIKTKREVLSKYKSLCMVSGEKPLSIHNPITKTGRFKHKGDNLIFEVVRFIKGQGIIPK